MVRTGCRMIVVASLLGTASAALRAYPHQMAYFNSFHGGLGNGHERLLHSNVDWGQDWLLCRDALFGRTKSVSHNYQFVYASESNAAVLAGCYRDLIDLRAALAEDPPGTPFGFCVGRTMAGRILQGGSTAFVSGDIAEQVRRADGCTPVTPAILLFHCRTPD